MLKSNILFERVGGSLQPVIKTAQDVLGLIDLPPAYWSITSIATEAIAMDPEFLAYLDDDANGKIRIDEVKRALIWVRDTFQNYEGLENGSDTLRYKDLNTEKSTDARDILASATLAMTNTGRPDSTEISLTDIRDKQKIIAAGLSNGDGVIPPDMLSDEREKTIAELIMNIFGKSKDASGNDGFNGEALAKCVSVAVPYLKWLNTASESPEIMPFGGETAAMYQVYKEVADAIDNYFELCGAVRLFGAKPNTTAQPPNVMNKDEIAVSMQKAPIGIPNAKSVFSLDEYVNPQWRMRLVKFFALFLPEEKKFSEEKWNEIKDKMAPYIAWLNTKPGTQFDDVDPELLQYAVTNNILGKYQQMVESDQSHAKEIASFGMVKKLILFQQNLIAFLNNYVNLSVLFDTRGKSFLLAGTLVMDGRTFRLATRVNSIPEHKKIALRSNICIMYLQVQTGIQTALKQMQLAVAVTSGDMYNLFIGKYGVFYTPDGTIWDARVVDFIQQPASFWEAVRMPFYRFGEFISKQLDKFFTARTKEFEQGFDKTMTQAQNFKPGTAAPAPAKVQTPAVSGSMMLMGGGVGLAAIGSAFAFIAQSLKNVSYWNVIGVFLIILLIFGGPMVLVSLIKLFRRNIAVFLEASGLAVNKKMRLSQAMGHIFTQEACVPFRNLSTKIDAVQLFLKKADDDDESKKRPSLKWVLIFLLIILICTLTGLVIWRISPFQIYVSSEKENLQTKTELNKKITTKKVK